MPIDDAPPNPSGERHLAAVQGLFLNYQPMVRAYVLSMVPDFALAEDVVQETFLVVSRKAPDFRIGTSFPAWVKTIARFKALEALRRQRGRLVALSDEALDALGAEPHEYAGGGEVDARLELLRACLDDLAPQARRSIEFRYRGDHLPRQIARLMGCTVQSVNVTLSRARAFLRKCVQRRMTAESS